MIPKFNAYLKESVWGDMRKKSLGQEARIEEDVNNMDAWEFYDYLSNRYTNSINSNKYTDSNDSEFDDETGDQMSFLIYIDDYDCYCSLEEINDNTFVSLSPETVENHELYRRLCEVFDVIYRDNSKNPLEETRIDIWPKDGSENIDFKFYVTVLDFFVNNVKNKSFHIEHK